MALTEFQRSICLLLAENRIRSGISYVAGGAALNEILEAPRVSRDIDVFHDTAEAVEAAWSSDNAVLSSADYEVFIVRERPGFIEAVIRRHGERVIIQWTRDSAYRFFPLIRHDDLGLTLHPFDLAANKVLALVGRVEPRDFIDTLACHDGIQPLGYLAWAACGKDPGFSPSAILAQAARSTRYTAAELSGLAFEGQPPDPADLSKRWHAALGAATEIVSVLPADQVGKAVLNARSDLFRGDVHELRAALSQGAVAFHEGALRGAWPQIAR